MGLGGELPVASTLVSESVEAKERGKVVVLLESFWAAGWLVSALIAYFIIPDYGWRIALIITALPAFYAIYLRLKLPDSPRYTGKNTESRTYSAKYERSLVGKICKKDINAMDCLVYSCIFILWYVFMASKCHGY